MRLRTLVLVLLGASACVVRVDPRRGDSSPDLDPDAADGTAGRPVAPATDTHSATAGAFPDDITPARAPLRVMTWNVEWLGDPDHGPNDEALQERGVVALLDRWHPDLVALQEVSDAQVLARLTERIAGMHGVIAQAPTPQKLALLHSAARFEVEALEEIAGLDDAGRPPLYVTLRDRTGGANLHVVVIHAKAGRDAADWQRRRAFADGLARTLARQPAGASLILLGDFNDRIGDDSIVAGFDSPYASLFAEGGHATPTADLGASSTSWGAIVDHIVVGNALAPSIEEASVQVVREEALAHAPDFLDQVSDHFPVTLELAP